MKAIEVKQVSHTVMDGQNPLTILHDVSLTVNREQTLAVTGYSGSGKSTLLGMMAGLDVPTQGEIWLMGREITRLNEEQRAFLRAKHVGFVFQAFQLLPNLTALENVMLPLELTQQDAEAPAKSMLARVGLEQRYSHYPRTLSGGEQQRVALARAFVMQPDILFADEPTGSLDTVNGENIIRLIFELQQEQGTTVVLVTHDMELASRCQQQFHLQA